MPSASPRARQQIGGLSGARVAVCRSRSLLYCTWLRRRPPRPSGCLGGPGSASRRDETRKSHPSRSRMREAGRQRTKAHARRRLPGLAWPGPAENRPGLPPFAGSGWAVFALAGVNAKRAMCRVVCAARRHFPLTSRAGRGTQLPAFAAAEKEEEENDRPDWMATAGGSRTFLLGC